MKDQRWQDWITSIVGLFVFFSPWILPFFFGRLTVDLVVAWALWIIGGVIAVVGLSALANPHRWEEWAQMILGVCLMSSPYALGFHHIVEFTWTAVIAGTLVVVLSVWALVSDGDNIPYQH